jgi:hypothetical protein
VETTEEEDDDDDRSAPPSVERKDTVMTSVKRKKISGLRA